MPLLQAISERFNSSFSRESISGINIPDNADELSIGELAHHLELIKTPHEKHHVDGWPSTLQDCLKATVLSALRQQPRVPIQLCWAPDYDYSVTIWDAHSTQNSHRAITILLRGPYPN